MSTKNDASDITNKLIAQCHNGSITNTEHYVAIKYLALFGTKRPCDDHDFQKFTEHGPSSSGLASKQVYCNVEDMLRTDLAKFQQLNENQQRNACAIIESDTLQTMALKIQQQQQSNNPQFFTPTVQPNNTFSSPTSTGPSRSNLPPRPPPRSAASRKHASKHLTFSAPHGQSKTSTNPTTGSTDPMELLLLQATSNKMATPTQTIAASTVMTLSLLIDGVPITHVTMSGA
jgi:hypothetical protein